MYRFRSIKYIATTGIITGLLIVIGYTSSLFFGWAINALMGGNSTLQLFDALFMPFCAIFEGPMLLITGPLAGAIFDLISGVRMVTIPATILIRILMFLVIKVLINKRWWSSIYSFFFAGLILVVGYPVYYIFVYNDYAIVINELIVDAIQASIAYVIALPIYYAINYHQIKTNFHFWDDRQFNIYKQKQNKSSK